MRARPDELAAAHGLKFFTSKLIRWRKTVTGLVLSGCLWFSFQFSRRERDKLRHPNPSSTRYPCAIVRLKQGTLISIDHTFRHLAG